MLETVNIDNKMDIQTYHSALSYIHKNQYIDIPVEEFISTACIHVFKSKTLSYKCSAYFIVLRNEKRIVFLKDNKYEYPHLEPLICT